MKSRIEYLDGLRGVAILLVVFYHAYARWPGMVPYADEYSDILIFKAGWLGVPLFFFISGFVILMTLERCSSFKEFIFRRWIRLFPAMLFCSAIIYISSGYFYERPEGVPSLVSLLPGLTFLEPSWIGAILDRNVHGLEGAFWSLYVEVKFYVFAAAFYFWMGRNKLIISIFAAYFIWLVGAVTLRGSPNEVLSLLYDLLTTLSFRQFGWFASGACFYVFFATRNRRWYLLGLLGALASTISVANLGWKWMLLLAGISLFFALVIVNDHLQRLLSNKVLLFFGFISYPLYLIHGNLMISIIVKMDKYGLWLPSYLYPVLSVSILSLVSYLIASYGERYFRRVFLSYKNSWFAARADQQ